MNKELFSAKNLTISAIIAALYAVVTIVLAPISYGAVQFRISEAMTILPILFPQAIPGLTIGCLIANIFGSATPWDIVFGTLATLIAALLTRKFRKNKWIAAAWPVICNAIIVGVVLSVTLSLPLIATILSVGLGELVVVYAIGIPLILGLKRIPQINTLIEK